MSHIEWVIEWVKRSFGIIGLEDLNLQHWWNFKIRLLDNILYISSFPIFSKFLNFFLFFQIQSADQRISTIKIINMRMTHFRIKFSDNSHAMTHSVIEDMTHPANFWKQPILIFSWVFWLSDTFDRIKNLGWIPWEFRSLD